MNIYQTLYDLIDVYVYGSTIDAGTIPDLVATLIATAGVVFLVALPFIVVLRVIRLICG